MQILDARVEMAGSNKWLKVLVEEYDTSLFQEWGIASSHGCFPVHLTDSKEVWKRNHTFFAEWLPIGTAREAIENFVPGWRLGPGALLTKEVSQ